MEFILEFMALITIVPQLLASGFWLLKLPVSWGAAALECSCVGGRQHRLGCSPREVVETWCCSPGSEKDEDHWCHEHGSHRAGQGLLADSGCMVPMSRCALEEQQMKDCGISTTALTLYFVTALPHFPLEICVQNCFRLKQITSICL